MSCFPVLSQPLRLTPSPREGSVARAGEQPGTPVFTVGQGGLRRHRSPRHPVPGVRESGCPRVLEGPGLVKQKLAHPISREEGYLFLGTQGEKERLVSQGTGLGTGRQQDCLCLSLFTCPLFSSPSVYTAGKWTPAGPSTPSLLPSPSQLQARGRISGWPSLGQASSL